MEKGGETPPLLSPRGVCCRLADSRQIPCCAPVVGTSAGALLALLIGIHMVGMYIALLGFLLFYIKVIGRHDWGITILLVGGIPLFIFGMFEWALQIPLPKAITEEWFYPVFDVMYGTNYFWAYMIGASLLVAALAFLAHKFIDPVTEAEKD